MIELADLPPAEEQAWGVLLDLAEEDSASWVLVGGQMVFLLAREHGVERSRISDDADVLVNVRVKQDGTQWLSKWLVAHGFEMAGINRDGIGHRFERIADPGPGKVAIDVLAPEGLGPRTSTTTISPARTVQAPGGSQAIRRSALVEVSVSGITGQSPKVGMVRRPSLLGAIIAKSASIGEIVSRDNPERDWEDVAFMLSFLPDPDESAVECDSRDRERLAHLMPLLNSNHYAWNSLRREEFRAGESTLRTLLGT